MVIDVVARRYARAFYREAAARGVVRQALAALFEFAASFQKEPTLRKFLLHPGIPSQAKEKIIGVLADEPFCREFLKLLLAKGRIPLAPGIYEEALDYYRREAGILPVTVTVAAPLGEEMRVRFGEVLGKLTGKEIELEVQVDPAVIGGVRLRIGDRVIDGTLANRLRRLRDAMAGTGFKTS